MRVSDYIMIRLAALGVKQVYFLPGGGAMHLNDALARNKDLEPVLCLHEQACSIAAEAAGKIKSAPSACLVTTGPGGTNTVTGVLAAWLDSTPVFFVSGQVKTADLKRNSGVRILGVQEADIVSIVSSITKKAVTLLEPLDVAFVFDQLEEAALVGRRGPVWLDVPLDVQAAVINTKDLRRYIPAKTINPSSLDISIYKVIDLLSKSQRPVLIAGNGIRIAGAADKFRELVEKLGVPVQTTWLGMDLLEEDHNLYAGRPGSLAPRWANFTLQNADLLIVIGSRLDMAMTAYAHDRFARGAIKVMVDIDPNEINKMGFKVELPIVSDAKIFIERLSYAISNSTKLPTYNAWKDKINLWKSKYPLLQKEHLDKEGSVSVYNFTNILSDFLKEGDIIAPGSSGMAIELFLLVLRLKKNQRCFHNRGTGSMGFGLPSAIGACFASNKQRTICVEGDGGMQFNIQELATLSEHKLPVKIFVINNDGYASIRSSQSNYFKKLLGADSTSGMKLPNLKLLCEAYGIAYQKIDSATNLEKCIKIVLEGDYPTLCEVISMPDEARIPRVASKITSSGKMESSPLEDLFPFLDRAELKENMFIPLID
jgi:acetolactate synthase-1/2/3 large subunit